MGVDLKPPPPAGAVAGARGPGDSADLGLLLRGLLHTAAVQRGVFSFGRCPGEASVHRVRGRSGRRAQGRERAPAEPAGPSAGCSRLRPLCFTVLSGGPSRKLSNGHLNARVNIVGSARGVSPAVRLPQGRRESLCTRRRLFTVQPPWRPLGRPPLAGPPVPLQSSRGSLGASHRREDVVCHARGKGCARVTLTRGLQSFLCPLSTRSPLSTASRCSDAPSQQCCVCTAPWCKGP